MVWYREEEVYPEGKRVKTLVYCPSELPYNFLEAKHRYIFKRSADWAPEQFWVEIFAYYLGKKMGIDVPPAFAAFDSERNSQCGALIRWFLAEPLTLLSNEGYIRGGDLCQQYIAGFDRGSGKQHNFKTVEQIFHDLTIKYHGKNEVWQSYWAKAFVFDALIGNTDRHQDNWGIIEELQFETSKLVSGGIISFRKKMRISPVFDNGSSMGYEVLPKKFQMANDKSSLERYVLRGLHHMRWSLSDLNRVEHCDFLKMLIQEHVTMKEIMLSCLGRVNYADFEEILHELTLFDIPVQLSNKRAEFMLELIKFRHERLLVELKKI